MAGFRENSSEERGAGAGTPAGETAGKRGSLDVPPLPEHQDVLVKKKKKKRFSFPHPHAHPALSNPAPWAAAGRARGPALEGHSAPGARQRRPVLAPAERRPSRVVSEELRGCCASRGEVSRFYSRAALMLSWSVLKSKLHTHWAGLFERSLFFDSEVQGRLGVCEPQWSI